MKKCKCFEDIETKRKFTYLCTNQCGYTFAWTDDFNAKHFRCRKSLLCTMHILLCQGLDNPALRNYHGLINYIDIKANVKMSSFKTIYLQMDFAAVCFSVWSPMPHTTPYLTYHTYSHREGGGGGGGELTKEWVRGATVLKAGSNIQTWLTVSPVYKLW